MKVIHKFNCNSCGVFELPSGKVLSVATQYGKPVVYVERDVDGLSDNKTQEVLLVGTGWEFEGKGHTFIGTVLTHGESIVSHAFLYQL